MGGSFQDFGSFCSTKSLAWVNFVLHYSGNRVRPDKDAINRAKHGISLARAADLEVLAAIQDDRFVPETRFRAYGLIDGVAHCLAYTVRREIIRAISLRRAHAKEMKRHAP